jgi:hypothetical protein
MLLSDVAPDDLEVWGFEGVASVVCGLSLPIVRHKSTNRFCALSLARRGGPTWSSQSEIDEHLRSGRLARFAQPLLLPQTAFPLRASEQPLIAWAQDLFWRSLDMPDEQTIRYQTQGLGWSKQEVLRQVPSPAGSLPAEETVKPRRDLWIACAAAADVESDLDDWAQDYRDQFDKKMLVLDPDWFLLKQLADHGLCAARSAANRYTLYVRYCAALYYSPLTSSRAADWQQALQLFRVIIQNEFPSVNWDRFRQDMAFVMERSRDVLRFQVETAFIKTQSEQVPGWQSGIQVSAVQGVQIQQS